MVIFKKSGEVFVSIGNPLRLDHADGRVSCRPRGGEFAADMVIDSGHYLAKDEPEIDPLREKLSGYVEDTEEGYIVSVVNDKSAEECSVDACSRACLTFDADLSTGCQTTCGLVMDAKPEHYHFMSEGLEAVLSSPDHANGDMYYTVKVVDKNNQPHDRTIADAMAIVEEMKVNYWTAWGVKTGKRAAVKLNMESDQTDAEKIEALVAL